jgi:hypothetical protein
MCRMPHLSCCASAERGISLLTAATPLSRTLSNIPAFSCVIHDCVMSLFAGHCGGVLWSRTFRFGRGQKQRGKRRGHRFVFILESNCHASCFLDILLNPLPLAMILFLTLLTCFFFVGWMTGGTAHALGTATVLTTEPLIAPTSAVTFLVTGKTLRQHHEIFVYGTLYMANYCGGGLSWAAVQARSCDVLLQSCP